MVKPKNATPQPKMRNSLGARTNRIVKGSPKSSKSSGAAANIKVIVRVRPPNSREQGDKFRKVVKVVSDQVLVFDPKEDDQGFFYRGVRQPGRDLLKKPYKEMTFMFDHVFAERSTTHNIFMASTHSLIDNLMDGYNCSVFAYGATGAGKTHTMTGNEEFPGITFLTLKELFQKQEELANDREFELGITYLEVYNELVKDLLNPGPPLDIREDSTYGVTVAGIRLFKITHSDELFKLLVQGNKNRTQHPTDANAESSRSHAVFQVYIQMTIKGTNEVRRAKLSMIDLAGSERGSATNYSGARFIEGANINKSLLALGNCINGLADGHRHIPYRDSKLTRLLKDSLGGNCYTVMIANVSPSSLSFEDTYNTLKYAMRAKKIKSAMKKNIISLQMNARQYVKITEELEAKNNALKTELEETKQTNLNMKKEIEYLKSRVDCLSKTQLAKDVEYKEEVVKEVEELVKEGLELIDRECQLHCDKDQLGLRRAFKEENFILIDNFCMSIKKQEDNKKRLDLVVDRANKDEESINRYLEMVEMAKKDVLSKLDRIQEENPEVTSMIEKEKLKMSAREDRLKYENEKKQGAILLKRNHESQALLHRTAAALQFCFTQLHGHDLVSSKLRRTYEELIADLEQKKYVTFMMAPAPSDSAVGSTTSITSTTDDDPPANGTIVKVKETEEMAAADVTFLPEVASTPTKPKAKGTVKAITKVRTPGVIKKPGVKPKSPKLKGILKKVNTPDKPRFKF